MNKLKLLICSDHASAFNKIIADEGYSDVSVIEYPSICKNKKDKLKAAAIVEEALQDKDNIAIIASTFCDIFKMLPAEKQVKILKRNFCFGHLIDEGLANYIIAKGGYLVSTDWLESWPEHLKTQGFDQETAQVFYKSFAKELILFDTDGKQEIKEHLAELSAYLDLPYKIIKADLEKTRHFVTGLVCQWRLQKQLKEHSQMAAELRAQCAEYAAVLDLLAKLSSYTNKREATEKVKEIFITVFGARHFKYHSAKDSSVAETKPEACSEKACHQLFTAENRFLVKISHGGQYFGIISVGNFLFPQYIEKYYSLAIEITSLFGLVLSNIEHFERLEKEKENYRVLSYHDSLTGFYNRTYLNSVEFENTGLAVFSFDIDNLKEVNDTYGHNEGDQLIRTVAKILKRNFRDSDTLIRMGGDEFISIVRSCERQNIEAIKERIKKDVAIFNTKEQAGRYKISISTGYALANKEHNTLESLIKEADRMMYAEKRKKKNKQTESELK